jgi:hypothetical protein
MRTGGVSNEHNAFQTGTRLQRPKESEAKHRTGNRDGRQGEARVGECVLIWEAYKQTGAGRLL